MIEVKVDSWINFKNLINSKTLRPQWFQGKNSIDIYAFDGNLCYKVSIENESDISDFETNYKSLWNQQLSFSDSSGIQQLIPSSRPKGTSTFFTGIDDNNVCLDFNMTIIDSSIVKELTFNEDIWMKDGGVRYQDAPFGSYFTVESVHPQEGVIAKYCRKLFMLGTGMHELNSEDKTLLTQGLSLRVSVFNATTPANFKVIGWLEGFRATMT